jgi:pimeloyl-ACP methyl ester carboxylesterase
MLPWFFSDALLADEIARARTERGLARTLARVKAPALARWAAGIRAWSGSRVDALERVTAPTLVVTAGRDLLAPEGETIAAQIPGARLERIGDAGHALAIEAADAVNAALEGHIDA